MCLASGARGAGPGEPLLDPVTGDELAEFHRTRIGSSPPHSHASNARSHGWNPAAPAHLCSARRDLLGKIADALAANRDEYFSALSRSTWAPPRPMPSFDVDGAIYTMKYYAKIGRALAKEKC